MLGVARSESGGVSCVAMTVSSFSVSTTMERKDDGASRIVWVRRLAVWGNMNVYLDEHGQLQDIPPDCDAWYDDEYELLTLHNPHDEHARSMAKGPGARPVALYRIAQSGYLTYALEHITVKYNATLEIERGTLVTQDELTVSVRGYSTVTLPCDANTNDLHIDAVSKSRVQCAGLQCQRLSVRASNYSSVQDPIVHLNVRVRLTHATILRVCSPANSARVLEDESNWDPSCTFSLIRAVPRAERAHWVDHT